jgi:hypothetical protein
VLLEKVKPLAHDVQSRALRGLDPEGVRVCQDILLQIYGNVIAGQE